MADNKDENQQASTPARKRPSGLGRGLNALFVDVPVEAPVLATQGSAASSAPVAGDSVQPIPLGPILPLPGQLRRLSSVARPVGTVGVSTCRSPWFPLN